MSELNEREQKIVDLISQLAEYANDETTAQGAIDGIIENIQQKTNDTIQKELKDAESDQSTDSPVEESDFSKKYNGLGLDGKLKMLSELSDRMTQVENMGGEKHECCCGGGHGNRNLIFTRIREVKAPGKAHPTDAGIDFYVPDEKSWNDEFKKTVLDYSKNPDDKLVHFEVDVNSGNQVLIVEPNAHVAIPSGIKTIIPEGLGMMFVNKSGIATKKKLDHSACLVDSEYRGEVIMCFFNHSLVPITIEPGMKLTQGLIVPIINLEMHEVLNCVYDDMGKDSDRGGGFGSSGTK